MSPPGPPETPEAIFLWRRFPWDAQAAENEPFSAAFVPPSQGLGRWDLPENSAGVVYFAETPEHAVGEWLARFRREGVAPADLRHSGRPQALVRVECRLPPERIADLCDPRLLARYGFAPDRLVVRDRTATQRVAAHLYSDGYAGLRWWSAFGGEWHTWTLFRDRLDTNTLHFGSPDVLRLDHPALLTAAEWLAVPIQADS